MLDGTRRGGRARGGDAPEDTADPRDALETVMRRSAEAVEGDMGFQLAMMIGLVVFSLATRMRPVTRSPTWGCGSRVR